MCKNENKESLQKVTETDIKIKTLLALKQIAIKDLEIFNDSEKEKFFTELSEMLNNLHGVEKDKLLNKVYPIISQSSKNQLWESNHNQITWAISTLTQEYGRFPSKTEIANKTELTRQTIHKHLKEFISHPQYIEQQEQYRFMASKVLAKVFYFAVNGDMKAARLYFDVIGKFNDLQSSNNTFIQNQNNYIQINGMVLSQEKIKQLKPEQLEAIEAIFKTLPED